MKLKSKRARVWLVVAAASAFLGVMYQTASRAEIRLGSPVLTNNLVQIALTNHCGRRISCRLSLPQFQSAGTWAELQSSEIYQFVNGQLLPPPSPILVESGSMVTLAAGQPRYIAAPFEADRWRLAVIWSYDGQSTWEKMQDRWQTWLTGKQSMAPLALHTNYTSEVIFKQHNLRKKPRL